MICNDRCRQSANIMKYMIDNPSNHTSGVTRCVNHPGLTCRSLHVKHENTVDTETLLLRGEQSVGIDPPHVVPQQQSQVEEHVFVNNESLSFMGETTRLSKSCNGEKTITSRLEDTLQPIRLSDRPYMNSTDLLGANSRNLSKYGKN